MKIKAIDALKKGEVLCLQGIYLIADGSISAGDIYIAQRNTGPHLLTAKEVTKTDCGTVDIVHPVDFPAYSFNGSDCIKVREATWEEISNNVVTFI